MLKSKKKIFLIYFRKNATLNIFLMKKINFLKTASQSGIKKYITKLKVTYANIFQIFVKIFN